MTIYTVMESTDRISWISKSFTCERQAVEFKYFCDSCARRINTLNKLLIHSPDPKLHDNTIQYHLLAGRRIRYEVFSNELVTDAFMELTLQPHKPNLPFKEFL